LGTQKAVVVQAALNANTNPNLAIEWFVNDTKSNQTGRVFEYNPATAGTFVIQAKVGNVLSNRITATVGTASSAAESKFLDADTIEIKATGGAVITVANNEVLDSSIYDLKKGVYVINLKTALKQGDVATVTLTREGNQVSTQLVTFDTRKLEVAAVSGTGVKDNKDNTYDIFRPHALNAGAASTVSNQYIVTFKSTDISGTSVGYKIEQVSVPTGATPILTNEGLAAVAGTDGGARSITFALTKDSIPGAYVYRYTLGVKSVQFTVNVKVPVREITNDKFELLDLSTVTPDWDVTNFNLFFKANGAAFSGNAAASGAVGVVANADGSFDITKNYLKGATEYKEIGFSFDGQFFDVPANLVAQTGVSPNQVSLSVLAPDGTANVRVQAAVTANTIPAVVSFRDSFSNFNVPFRFDNDTVVGKYTFTLSVRQLGEVILTKDVVVNVKAPVADIKLGTIEQRTTDTAPATTTEADATTYWFNTYSNQINIAQDTVSWSNAQQRQIAVVTAAPSGASNDPIGTMVFLKDTSANLGSLFIKKDAGFWTGGTTAMVTVTSVPQAIFAPGSATNEVIYKFEKVKDNDFKIQRPVAGADTQVLIIPFTLENYESPAKPAALAADAFSGLTDTLRKELLTYKRTYVGPMTLPSAFNLDSKAAVELGVANATATVNNLATTPVAFTRFGTASALSSVSLGNQFVFEVNSLTSAGSYKFTIQIGELTEVVNILVEEPVAQVDFKVVTNATNTVDATHKFTLGADGKYYGTLGWAGANGSGGAIFADLSLLMRNMFPGTTNVAYSVTRVTPKTSDTFANVLAYSATAADAGITLSAGRNGHLQAPALLVLITGDAIGASALGTNTTRSTSITAPQSLSRLDITEAGNYKLTVTVAGVTKVIDLVVNKYPTLTIKSSDAQLVDGAYVVKASADAIKVKLSLEGSNLPSGSLFYKVFNVETGFYNAVFASRASIIAGALSFDLAKTATQEKSLAFTGGLLDLELTIAAGTGTNNTKVYQVIGIYSRSVKDANDFTYTLVGHLDVTLGEVILS
jgi:hypothetical protein